MPAVDRIADLLYPWQTTELVSLVTTRLVPLPDLSRRTTWVSVPTGKRHLGPYTVKHPGLLDQIEHTVTGSTTGGQTFHAAYGSKPAGRLDALAWLARLDTQSRELSTTYGLRLRPLRPRLSSLAGCIGLKKNSTVTGWWTSARVLTQHDMPPAAPRVPCPNEECDRWGTLRIRFNPNVALCVHCGTTWTDPDFDRFVVWVRWASEHLQGPNHPGCSECLVERSDRYLRSATRLEAVR